MTLELYLIRHAESVNNVREDFIGGQSVDAKLTENGERQACLLGEHLMRTNAYEKAFDSVYASPAIRAATTAEIACAYFKPDIVHSTKLLEISQGDWAGKQRSIIYTPELRRVIERDPLNFRAPNGETQAEVEARGLSFLNDIGYRDIDGRVALFGHGMQIKCLLHGIMQFDPHLTWKIGIDNTSITRLDYDDRGWHLKYLNTTPHLEARR